MLLNVAIKWHQWWSPNAQTDRDLLKPFVVHAWIARHSDGGEYRITTAQANTHMASDYNHAEASGIKPKIQQSIGVFWGNQDVNDRCH